MIVKFFPWDQLRNVSCPLKDVLNGDCVVVEHEWGTLMADVIAADKALLFEIDNCRKSVYIVSDYQS